jgi:Spermidine synthase
MRRFNDRLVYAAAIFFSSALLFLSQPMMAKAILPWFGGSAGVWTACMLFFQVVLLLGYLYAYWVTRYLSARAQAAAHITLLFVSLAMLPVNPSIRWKAESPVLWILGLLATTIGLPYFVLSTTGPLMQAWYSRASVSRFPYRLFALSNLGSLLALLAYPLGIEPMLSLRHQLAGWSIGYLVFVLLAGCLALRSRLQLLQESNLATARSRPLLWIALAACSSSLWLSVANHLSQEVAAIPFLWVLPLSIYLLSFILCFDRAGWYQPRLYRWILPCAWIAMGLQLAAPKLIGGFAWQFVLLSIALLVCCLFCHGELASLKPEPREGLTFFYLTVAAGGAVGAVFVSLIAPHLFNSYLELPASIVACIILGLAILYGYGASARLARPAVLATLAFAAATYFNSSGGNLLRERNFYGTLRVIDSGSGASAVRALYNGIILHGMQFLAPEQSRLPTTYYGPQSGGGLAITSHRAANQRVGVIGLGAGTLAAYGRAGDYLRFYEINPAVIEIASHYFNFLQGSAAQTEVVAGDGRLALEREPAQNFDVLIVDAFSGDSIPVHLLTTQAFDIYFHQLRPGGILALHITNRYLDLGPVVQALAAASRKQALLIHNAADRERGVYESDWSLVADDLALFGTPQKTAQVVRPWTDDYSNLFRILR